MEEASRKRQLGLGVVRVVHGLDELPHLAVLVCGAAAAPIVVVVQFTGMVEN